MPTVLITGANRGLGLGFAQHYLNAGWQVIGTARDPSESRELRALVEEGGSGHVVEPLDVGCDESIRKLGVRLASRNVRLDLLINNAGVADDESFGDWTSSGFVHSFRVNSIGPALLAQALVSLLTEGSKIINATSGMASLELNINPEGPADGYAMSKAAVNMLTRRLASKLRERQITVTAINPGWVKTAMGGDAAPTQIDEAIEQMTTTIDALRPDQSGCFLSPTGEVLPW